MLAADQTAKLAGRLNLPPPHGAGAVRACLLDEIEVTQETYDLYAEPNWRCLLIDRLLKVTDGTCCSTDGSMGSSPMIQAEKQ